MAHTHTVSPSFSHTQILSPYPTHTHIHTRNAQNIRGRHPPPQRSFPARMRSPSLPAGRSPLASVCHVYPVRGYTHRYIAAGPRVGACWGEECPSAAPPGQVDEGKGLHWGLGRLTTCPERSQTQICRFNHLLLTVMVWVGIALPNTITYR